MPSGKTLSEEEKKERKEFMLTHRPEEFSEKYGIMLSSAYVLYSKYDVRIERKKTYTTRLPNIPKETFAPYAENHVLSNVCSHFGIGPTTARKLYKLYDVQQFRVQKFRNEGSGKTRQSPLRKTGEAHDMIRFLAKEYTFASIGRVFGYSKERIRQICNREETV